MSFSMEQSDGKLLPVHEVFTRVAREKPDAIAVVCGHAYLSYGELERRAQHLAKRLSHEHIVVESRVALCLGRVADMVVAMLATLKVGAAYVPLDPAYPEDRLNFMLTDSGAQIIVTEAGMQKLSDAPTPVLFIDELPADELAGVELETITVDARNLAWIIYTSGSTGQPKGVGIEHRGALALVEWSNEVFTDDEMAGVMASTSWCFDLSAFEIWAPLLRGGSAIILDNALELANIPNREQVRLINSVPVAVNELAALGEVPPSVKTVNLAGEPLTRDLVDKLYALAHIKRVLNLYGPTEDTTYSTWAEMKQSERGAPLIGVALTGSSAYVLDENGDQVTSGTVGELYLGGVGLARGYIGHPAMTATKFVPNPYDQSWGERLYRTGDLVRALSDGNLEFIGRADHQVKIRGLRIELGEIEAVLGKHDRVQDALVVARERDGEKLLVGYVVVSMDGAENNASGLDNKFGMDLQDYLRGLLPQFMVPSAIVILQRWPLTLNGKIDRKSLPEPEFSSYRNDYVAPRTPVEKSVEKIWQDVLKVKNISADASFFHLGGDSLAATRIIARVRESFGIRLTLQKVLEAVSIAQMSALIEATPQGGKKDKATGSPELTLRPVAQDGPLPLSYFQQRLWLSEQMNPGNGSFNVFIPFHWSGPLVLPTALQAFSEIVRRHAVLRSRFGMSGEKPAQWVHAYSFLAIPVVDLTGLAENKRKAEAMRLAGLESRRSFDLGKDSPLRIRHLRLQPDEYIILITMHHIATDGASIAIFGEEFSALSRAFSGGQPSALPEMEIQYSDFAYWQREWLAGSAFDHQREYWKRQMQWVPRKPGLKTDRPRKQTASLCGAYQSFAIQGELLQDFLKLGATESATAFMVILAAFEALLYRLSGETDWVVGTDIANRTLPRTESPIGFFVNVLALRTRITPRMTFRQLLQRVRHTALEAYAHQDLPFDEVLKTAERDVTSPLFQVFFVLQNEADEFLSIPGAVVSRLMLANDVALRELSLYGSLVGSNLNLSWNYRTDLFEAATIQRWTQNLLALIQDVIHQPDAALEDLRLLAPGALSHGEKPAHQAAQQKFRATKPKAVQVEPRT